MSRVAGDLFEVWASGAMPVNPNVAIGLNENISTPKMQPVIASALQDEAARLGVSRRDRPALVADAAQFVEWARATTQVRAVGVLARFAARAAFERTQQHVLTSVLADNEYPRRWSSSGRRSLVPGSPVGAVRVAFYPPMLAPLMAATEPFIEGKGWLKLRSEGGGAVDGVRDVGGVGRAGGASGPAKWAFLKLSVVHGDLLHSGGHRAATVPPT